MRIAFVTPEFVTEENYDGGLANYLARVAPALAGLGHEVTVIVRSAVDEEIIWHGLRVRRVAIGGPPLFFFNALLRDLRTPIDWIWQSWKINRALREYHRQEPFAVVQYASYTAVGLFRISGLASVVRISSYEPMIREAAGLDATLSRRLQAYLEETSLKRADGLFCPSLLVAKYAEDRLGRPVAVIESPFCMPEIELDEQPCEELLPGKRFLLFYGSIGVLKGVGDIAAIIGALLKAHPALHFVFIGKDLGHRGRPMMEQVWEKAGSCRGRVHYLGKMRHAQLLPIVSRAAAVVLPSRVDNLPNTCIEAMALGKIVIGTYGTSFEQLIEDGKSGLLSLPKDPSSLLEAIERLLGANAESLEGMGRKARARIEAMCGTELLDTQVAFYDRVLRGGQQ